MNERDYKNPVVGGRCITIDIYAKDSAGKVYDIEVQRSNSGAIPQRARFHSAMVDMRLLKEGQDFKEMHDSCVIFITQNDVLKGNLPVYHIDRQIDELDNKPFGDGSHIIYVNGAYKDDDTEIGRIVHDFGCVRPADMYCDLLRDQVRYYKETEGGRKIMSEIGERIAQRREESILVDKIKVVMNKLNDSVENAMEFLDIPRDQWSHYADLVNTTKN